MSFRFRKSFNIIPGLLRWTISKKGASLNLHLGIYSKSLGTGGRRTRTIDVPGTTGIFFRKQTREKQDPDDPDDGFGHFLQILTILISAIVGYIKINIHTGNCHLAGHPNIVMGAIVGGEIALFWFLWRKWDPLRGFLGFLLVIAATYLQWKLIGAWISPNICKP